MRKAFKNAFENPEIKFEDNFAQRGKGKDELQISNNPRETFGTFVNYFLPPSPSLFLSSSSFGGFLKGIFVKWQRTHKSDQTKSFR